MANNSNNTERQELINEIIPQLYETIKKKATNIFDVESITGAEIDNVASLPALYENGGVRKQVKVPLTSIVDAVTCDSETAMNAAIANCETATANANTAATNTQAAIKDAQTATTNCNTATENANTAITNCNTATDAANAAATNAQAAADTATTQSAGLVQYDTRIKQAHITNAEVTLSDDEETNTLKLTSENGDVITTTFKGGTGKIKSISVNGTAQTIDDAGNVNLKLTTNADESLDRESTNPIQNAPVAKAISDLQDHTVYGVEVENDGSVNTLKLTDKNGSVIAQTDFVGGGGGGGTTSVSKIVLSAEVSKTTIKEGDTSILTYKYDHQDGDGNTDGIKANITITVSRGTTTTYNETIKNVTAGTYTFDLSKYLMSGTTEVYVKAECTTESGTKQTKQAYAEVNVVTLNLTTSFNLAESFTTGGYTDNDTIEIPFAITGSGTKEVNMYIDANTAPTSQTITRSGTVYGSFTIKASTLKAGTHVIQLVADRDGLLSQSIYINILKAGNNSNYVGIMYSDPEGTIRTSANGLTPQVTVTQYAPLTFQYAAYNPKETSTAVQVYIDGTLTNTITANRAMKTYTNRFTDTATKTVKLQVGTASVSMTVNITESELDIAETSYALYAKLSAAGRSNSEANPATWTSGDIKTTFENVNWSSNGWTGDALKLTNGAKATILYQPFKSDIKSTGLTIEITMKVDNISDQAATVISCLNNNKGLLFTASEAAFKTGQSVTYTNEEDEQVTREIKLGTKYTSGQWYKIALAIDTVANNKLMHLYVNGNRTGADTYDSSFNFAQDTPQYITINSDNADIEIKTIRVYTRCISDDEELENYIVDADNTENMLAEYDTNNVLNDITGGIDIDKIRAKGKGVLRIVRENKLDDIYADNNKKTDYQADIYFWSPLGDDYNFVLKNCNIRIQGTSSTKYPSKNLRIYCNKGGENLSMTINGVINPLGSNKYKMRANAVPMNLFCCKSDYSDSSMSLNTGGAKLFNDIFKELKLLTPPQLYQYNNNGKSLNDITVRNAIDGVPIDIFCAETEDSESEYYGQYNFNNEKSKSQDLFGQEGLTGYTPTCALTLETLNNTEKTCLFQSESDDDLIANFDNGLETNYPDDVKWVGLSEAQQTALKRLFQWIRECKPASATSDNIASWTSTKFKSELSQYFDVDYILTYYLWTDYFVSVDQRAKNMLLRTWDGLIWYITYYDGDTQLGKRNDCFLVYDYTTDRDTYDAEASKYAFEGRDSWLWNMVLANFADELKTLAGKLRAVMTNERVLNMFNNEQTGSWSTRESNKSGEIKYITPAIQTMYGKTWPFIYALQGQNTAHREYFIKNRFALLDAKYGTSNFTSDNIDLYLSRQLSEAADVFNITASETYAFGYGTNNKQNIQNTGIVAGGKVATLSISETYTVNDPLRIYGASRMRILDMSGAASHLKNGLDLGKCTGLRELNLSASTTSAASTGWWLVITNCTALRTINLRNQTQAKTGSSTSTELDLTNQTKLQTLDAYGTTVQSILFAQGAPLTKVVFPATLKTLRLEYLDQLQQSGITFASAASIETFIFAQCALLDWTQLLATFTSIKRVRITGIDIQDDGTLLAKYKSLTGIDASGNYVDYCALVGKVTLTTYIDDDLYDEYVAKYPELTIKQPEYTCIVFDETVADPANITNEDNKTGYEYANDYEPSGHLLKILNARKQCMAKHSGIKQVTCYPLRDDNITYYNDNENLAKCTAADTTTGADGDVMIYEPHYWYKGVNDRLNSKLYGYFRYANNVPTPPAYKKILWNDIPDANIFPGRALRAGIDYNNIAEAETTATGYSYVIIDNVADYNMIRMPIAPHAAYGILFLNAEGKTIKRQFVNLSANGVTAGEYIFCQLPDNCTRVAFTISTDADFDYVLLTTSTDIADIEPDWVEHTENLQSKYAAYQVDNIWYSRKQDGLIQYSIASPELAEAYAEQRGAGYCITDYEMIKDVVNLAMAKRGTRSAGYESSQYAIMEYLWFSTYWGTIIRDKKDTTTQKLHALQTDGTTRDTVPFNANLNSYTTRIFYGKYMDLITRKIAGSQTTYYCGQNTAINNSEANMTFFRGIYFANHFLLLQSRPDSLTNLTSFRLCFRGTIKWAASAAAFKALPLEPTE